MKTQTLSLAWIANVSTPTRTSAFSQHGHRIHSRTITSRHPPRLSRGLSPCACALRSCQYSSPSRTDEARGRASPRDATLIERLGVERAGFAKLGVNEGRPRGLPARCAAKPGQSAAPAPEPIIKVGIWPGQNYVYALYRFTIGAPALMYFL